MFILGIKPLMNLLNSIVAGIDSPCLIAVDLISISAKFTSMLVSKHLFMVHFMSTVQVSNSPLLSWLYDYNTIWWVSSFLQNSGNFS